MAVKIYCALGPGEDLRRQDRAGGNGEPSENSHGEICTRVGAELRRLSDQFHSDVMEEVCMV